MRSRAFAPWLCALSKHSSDEFMDSVTNFRSEWITHMFINWTGVFRVHPLAVCGVLTFTTRWLLVTPRVSVCDTVFTFSPFTPLQSHLDPAHPWQACFKKKQEKEKWASFDFYSTKKHQRHFQRWIKLTTTFQCSENRGSKVSFLNSITSERFPGTDTNTLDVASGKASSVRVHQIKRVEEAGKS